MNFIKYGLGIFAVSIFTFPYSSVAQKKQVLKNDSLWIEWEGNNDGFKINKAGLNNNNRQYTIGRTTGAYTLLFSETKPAERADLSQFDKAVQQFPDSSYILIYNRWKVAMNTVAMNTAGKAFTFFPEKAMAMNGGLKFTKTLPQAFVSAFWQIDEKYKNDIIVEIEITAQKEGYYSIQTPSLFNLKKENLAWGMIPGHFQGNNFQKNMVLSYAYGQGIPDRPVITRERTASTLSPLVTDRQGVTVAVIPEPGTGRDPWVQNASTQSDWLLGLSLINRNNEVSPTLYHPVLGQKGSFMKPGESKKFRFRYTIKHDEWYNVYKHAVYNIYKFADFLTLKKTAQSLTDRILGMLDYVKNDATSLWHQYNYKGLEIGAQEYNAPVVGSNKDAVKNSDYGAMWMLAHLSGDSILLNKRLPYARNFKLVQQETKDNFFKGAAVGQYFLWKSNRFTEEWGNYVEPIALTYYALLDIGNILLFTPADDELKNRLRLAADRLLEWQQKDGSWVVAYDHDTEKQLFNEVKDLRATFYGCIVAYRILGEQKYLDAAVKGADWFIKNAVEKGHFLGVCGDFRFVADFATGQSVQALLDLFDITKNNKYKQAAIKTARIYTASVYTHPIPTEQTKTVGKYTLKDWQISQVGLSFEHGGTLGSAAKEQGPILLASHAGMFVRLFQLTNDSIFIDMARAAAWGRDAFVNKENSVASYYWNGFDNGPGKFPHHAWWQIGWITDYLLSEIALRSGGQINFPRGFITPKVGPHQSYGFQAGNVYGSKAQLLLKPSVVNIQNPAIDYAMAINKDTKKMYIFLLNNSSTDQKSRLSINYTRILDSVIQPRQVQLVLPQGNTAPLNAGSNWDFNIPAFGLQTIAVSYE